jgi:hypothetical protein
VGPYVALFSRADISREAADAAIANLDIHELPSARGCTYVLPAADFALGLKLAQPFEGGEMKVAEKLGVTAKEVDRLCDAVVGALEKEPLDPDGLKQATGKAVRNLGAEGQKKGLTTTLPLVLGKLQTSGAIRRIPLNGRLGQQRYKYTLWRPNPLDKFKLSTEEANVELARRFFSWTGPASVADFQEFAGLGVKAAKAATDSLQLKPLAGAEDKVLLPDDLAKWEAFKAPKDPQYTLVTNLDSILLLRRSVEDLLDDKDLEQPIQTEKALRPARSLSGLPSPAIFDRGRLIGLWEYNTATESIVWKVFGKKDKLLSAALEKMQEYVQSQLGDVRTFSLDSPKSRVTRIEALAK